MDAVDRVTRSRRPNVPTARPNVRYGNKNLPNFGGEVSLNIAYLEDHPT